MSQRFAPHPVVLLEPVINLALSGAILTASPLPSAAWNLALGVAFALIGILTAATAWRKIRDGVFRLEGEILIAHGAAGPAGRTGVSRGDITSVRGARGASTWWFDPAHQVLSRVVPYGYMVLTTRDGEEVLLAPVEREPGATALAAWIEGRPLPPLPVWRRGWIPGTLMILLGVFGWGVVALAGSESGNWPVLVGGAAALEATLWTWWVAGGA